MIKWKQRLYAFLLRRLLGPFLDSKSTQKLHDCIEVSFQEGKFVLTDISLNNEHISRLLGSKRYTRSLGIRSFHVDRLEIFLSLRERSSPAAPSSTLAWRALKLGSFDDAGPAVSLVAEIQISGVKIVLEPNAYDTFCEESPPTDLPVEESEPHSSSIVGSYLDAALKSLQLSLSMKDIKIDFANGLEQSSLVCLELSSLQYRDAEPTSTEECSTGEKKLITHKLIELSQATLDVGQEEVFLEPSGKRSTGITNLKSNSFRNVAMAEGTSTIHLRTYEIQAGNEPTSLEVVRRIQNVFDVQMNHKIHLLVDGTSIADMQAILNGFAPRPLPQDQLDATDTPAHATTASTLKNFVLEESNNDEDLRTLSVIMSQYREAYHLAENNELRGGILIPSNAYEDGFEDADDGYGPVTFDAFFDASEGSLYNFASILQESVTLSSPRNDIAVEDDNFVHTKASIFFANGSFKLNYGDHAKTLGVGHFQEYVLLSIEDTNVAFEASTQSSTLEVSIADILVEDSYEDLKTSNEGFVSIGGSPVLEKQMKRGVLLRFARERFDHDEEQADNGGDPLVAVPPSLSITLRTFRNESFEEVTEIDIDAAAMHMNYHQPTVSGLVSFLDAVQPPPTDDFGLDDEDEESGAGAVDPSSTRGPMHVSCSCPGISLLLPMDVKVDNDILLARGNIMVSPEPIEGNTLGIDISEFSLKVNNYDGQTSSVSTEALLSCHNAVVFVQTPVSSRKTLNTPVRRFDLFAAQGRLEINPYIPISFKITTRGSDDFVKLARSSFPLIPTISSFKARQQDDDDDDDEEDRNGAAFRDIPSVLNGPTLIHNQTDPQLSMLSTMESCSRLLQVALPDFAVDLTVAECTEILKLLEGLRLTTDTNKSEAVLPQAKSLSGLVGVTLSCDRITATLHGSANERLPVFSHILALDRFIVHCASGDGGLQHGRLLAHDLSFYEVEHSLVDASDSSLPLAVRDRALCNPQKSSVPIFYRSGLFAPISRESPSFLVDMAKKSELPTFEQKNIYVTLYHFTFRYDIDSSWMNNVKAHFDCFNGNGVKSDESTKSKGRDQTKRQLLTRLFVTAADCNVDYSSPSYFSKASRSLVRLGDIRLSSNITCPPGQQQSFRVSAGDIAFFICPHHYPYLAENARLCRASYILASNDQAVEYVSMSPAETLLREMEFVNVLELDNVDGTISTFRSNGKGYQSHPATTISISAGTLSMHSCKDSFECFSNTVGDLVSKLTALTDSDLNGMTKDSRPIAEAALDNLSASSDSISTKEDDGMVDDMNPLLLPLRNEDSTSFLLDGYDWMSLDHSPLDEAKIPDGEDQAAGWYSNVKQKASANPIAANYDKFGAFEAIGEKIIIRPQYFPIRAAEDPMSTVYLGARRRAGTEDEPEVKTRFVLQRFGLDLKLYDGFDWPSLLSEKRRKRAVKSRDFVIQDETDKKTRKAKAELSKEIAADSSISDSAAQRKAKLMGDLLDDSEPSALFTNPLPEERASRLATERETKLLSRKTNRYFRVVLDGIQVRHDGYTDRQDHSLTSIMNLSVSDISIAETVSSDKPVKMFGEWINEKEHPRDSRKGTLMLKVAEWKPEFQLNLDNEIVPSECEATMELLPMRCRIDQRAVSFVIAFFRAEESPSQTKETENDWMEGLHMVPAPTFREFRVLPWKMKVDYHPTKIDIDALRDGVVVELINLSPLDEMVITLKEVVVRNESGYGAALYRVTTHWVQDICSSQLHKFLTNARPFHPFSHVAGGLADLVVLPYEAFVNGESVSTAVRAGAKSLARTVAYQTLSTSSKITHYAAKKLSEVVVGANRNNDDPLPSRPSINPRGVSDVSSHAFESLTRGLQTANHKVVVVPYRELVRNGTTGAVRSVIRGIPVVILAPLSGASEALSYTLLGARNALRPDIRMEEDSMSYVGRRSHR